MGKPKSLRAAKGCPYGGGWGAEWERNGGGKPPPYQGAVGKPKSLRAGQDPPLRRGVGCGAGDEAAENRNNIKMSIFCKQMSMYMGAGGKV